MSVATSYRASAMREIVNSEQDRNQNGLRHEIGRTAPGEAQRHARPGGKENVRKHNEAMKRPHVKPFDNMVSQWPGGYWSARKAPKRTRPFPTGSRPALSSRRVYRPNNPPCQDLTFSHMAFSSSKRTPVLSANLRELPRIDFELAKIRVNSRTHFRL